MYTIKQAAIRTGVNVPLLRAWERRYGIPTPTRTASGYRLYDDEAIDRVRRMRSLLQAGWAPSQAARSILDGTAPDEPEAAESRPEGTLDTPDTAQRTEATPGPLDEIAWLGLRFLGASRALDEVGMESVLGDALAMLGVDEALERFVMPALVDIGEAWARGDVSVAAEHAASNAVMRRLAGLYSAASAPMGRTDCLIGLPPGSRHEIGALAFAVACRRAGLRVLYLGADLPVLSWLAAAREHPEAAVVLGAVTAQEAESAAQVAAALRSEMPGALIVAGGARRSMVAPGDPTVLLLPDGLRKGASALAHRLGRR